MFVHAPVFVIVVDMGWMNMMTEAAFVESDTGSCAVLDHLLRMDPEVLQFGHADEKKLYFPC